MWGIFTHLSVFLGLLIVPLVMSALSETAGRVAPPDVDSLTRETPTEEHVENLFRCHITLEPVGGVVLVKVAVPSTSAKGIRCQHIWSNCTHIPRELQFYSFQARGKKCIFQFWVPNSDRFFLVSIFSSWLQQWAETPFKTNLDNCEIILSGSSKRSKVNGEDPRWYSV